MKVFLKDQKSVLLQNRDICYLSEIGVQPFVPYAKEIKDQEEAMFVKITDPAIVEYLRLDDDIIDYFDYLTMDVGTLRQLTDRAEDDYASSVATYRHLEKKGKMTPEASLQLARKKYKFTTNLEMMQDKQTDGLLIKVPFGYDANDGYLHQSDAFITMATEVDGVYLFLNKKEGAIAKAENFKSYFQAEMVSILADVSKQQETYRADYVLRRLSAPNERFLFIGVQPKENKKTYHR